MGARSSHKGSAYERKVCVGLSRWISNLTRDDIFWRSAMSGGRATLAQRKGRGSRFEGSTGDITAVDPMGEPLTATFSIEVKAYKQFEIDRPAFDRKGELLGLWKAHLPKAAQAKRLPMLIGKQDNMGEVLLVTEEGGNIIEACSGPRPLVPTLHWPRHDVWIYLFRDFLANVDPALFVERYGSQTRS